MVERSKEEIGIMHTMSGKGVDLRNFTRDMVDLRDIALGLERICRFNGQTRLPFTVIEHSLIGSWMADDQSNEMALEALLHDTGEAYTGDIILPVKECFPEVVLFEDAITGTIFDSLFPSSCCVEGGKYVKSAPMARLDRQMAEWESYHFRPHLQFRHETWKTYPTWLHFYKQLPNKDQLCTTFLDQYRDLITRIQLAAMADPRWAMAEG